MDEPSAALSPRETEGLFQIIKELKSQGIGIIYISHRLDEIFKVSDRITFLRDGEHIDTLKTKELSRDDVISLMVGRTLENEFPKRRSNIGKPRLKVNNLSQGKKVQKVSFEIRSGEVVGLTGLVGAGRTETARLLFGAEAKDGGEIELDGKLLDIKSPRDAIKQNICLLTEDRKEQGLILNQTIRENFSLPNIFQFSTCFFIRKKDESNALSFYIDQIKMKITSSEQKASTLSGGNQQKVVLSKWLQRNSEVIIFDEPTRGIDVGAKFEIYQLINQLAEKGKAILMISSELPEILGMSDRVLVMNEGHITGEISNPREATQQDVMILATKSKSMAT